VYKISNVYELNPYHFASLSSLYAPCHHNITTAFISNNYLLVITRKDGKQKAISLKLLKAMLRGQQVIYSTD
jgi:hypothetical protein